MKNVLPFLVAASPGVLIFACMRSVSHARRSTEREVERLIAEMDEVLAPTTPLRARIDAPRRGPEESAISETRAASPHQSSADLSRPSIPKEE